MDSPQESHSCDSHQRKRVGKACDRCRLKKSKCDGASPCNRCKLDDAVCVFGERKKLVDRNFPRGYVEMLEQQQETIADGLRQMYHKIKDHGLWTGPELPEVNGHPLTHDILHELGVLKTRHGQPAAAFEDDLEAAEIRLRRENGDIQRRMPIARDSISSCDDSVHVAADRKDSMEIKSSCSTPTSHSFSPLPSPPQKRRSATPSLEHALDTPPDKKLKLEINALPCQPYTTFSPAPIELTPDFFTIPMAMDSQQGMTGYASYVLAQAQAQAQQPAAYALYNDSLTADVTMLNYSDPYSPAIVGSFNSINSTFLTQPPLQDPEMQCMMQSACS